jgi:hypothetical protein
LALEKILEAMGRDTGYDFPPYDANHKALKVGDFCVIVDPGNHHHGLRCFYIGESRGPDWIHAAVWYPYDMWRVAKNVAFVPVDETPGYPIVRGHGEGGWNYYNLRYLAEGSFCSVCEEWFVGEDEYLCPTCR